MSAPHSAEPPIAVYLRGIYQELANVVAPDASTQRGRNALAMVLEMLSHLAVREARGREFLSDQGEAPSERDWHRRALEAEAAFSAAAIASDTRNVLITEESLTRYLRARLPGSTVKVARVRAVLGGLSKLTAILDLDGSPRPADRIVIRRDVPGGAFENNSVLREVEVLRVLHSQGVAVAEPLWVEEDASVLGQPFLVTAFAEGEQFADLQTHPVERSVLENANRELARVLAAVHRIDVDAAGLAGDKAGAPLRFHVSSLIDASEAEWRRRRLWPSPIVTAGYAWLRANICDTSRPRSIVHGDASIRNLLIHQGRAAALLDWETWHIGDAAEDLAYAEDEIAPHMPFEKFLDAYYAAGGAQVSAADLQFWRIWRHTRNAAHAAACIDGAVSGATPGVIPAYMSVKWHRYCVGRLYDCLNATRQGD